MGELSKKAELSQHYTNHCIQVSGVTNLTRANFTSKQVMSVSVHKSVESLALYQRVNEDEKMMMGLCLTYSLMNPHNTRKAIEPVPQDQNVRMLPSTSTDTTPFSNETPVKQVQQPTPNENAVVPYNNYIQKNQAPQPAASPKFDLMELLSETLDDVKDEKLVMAATQYEQAPVPSMNIMTNTSTSVIKRNNPTTTFTNCSSGSIGTLNIHIHKQ